METYIEYAIIDNLVIDFLILSLVVKTNKLHVKKIIVFLIAVLGTIIAIISPFLSGISQIIVKIACGILMPLLLQKYKTKKQTITVILTFWIVSFIFGGACIAFCLLFNIEYITNNGAIMVYNYPIGLATLLCVLLYYLLKNIIKTFFKNKTLEKFIYQIIIVEKSKEYQAKAYLDSGNMLIDKESNKPITIINYELFSQIFPNIKLTDILLKRFENLSLKKIKEIEINSLTKSSKILTFEIDNIRIKQTNIEYSNARLGLSLKDFKLGVDVNCILSPMLFD